MIQPSISVSRHRTDAPIRTGAGILPLVCHFRTVVGCTSNLTASAWASIKDSVGTVSLAFVIFRLLYFRPLQTLPFGSRQPLRLPAICFIPDAVRRFQAHPMFGPMAASPALPDRRACIKLRNCFHDTSFIKMNSRL
jgi:hypothetical protein